MNCCDRKCSVTGNAKTLNVVQIDRNILVLMNKSSWLAGRGGGGGGG